MIQTLVAREHRQDKYGRIKIWNAARYVMMNMEDKSVSDAAHHAPHFSPADRWIISRFESTAKQIE